MTALDLLGPHVPPNKKWRKEATRIVNLTLALLLLKTQSTLVTALIDLKNIIISGGTFLCLRLSRDEAETKRSSF